MSDKNFVEKYLEDFSSLVKPNDQIVEKIISARDILVQAKKNNAKIMILEMVAARPSQAMSVLI